MHYGIAFFMKDTCDDYVGNSAGLGAYHMCAIKCILRDLTFEMTLKAANTVPSQRRAKVKGLC